MRKEATPLLEASAQEPPDWTLIEADLWHICSPSSQKRDLWQEHRALVLDSPACRLVCKANHALPARNLCADGLLTWNSPVSTAFGLAAVRRGQEAQKAAEELGKKLEDLKRQYNTLRGGLV